MNKLFLSWCAVAMLSLTAQGGIIYSPANPINASIPDSSGLGWSGTATASGYLPSISEVTVNLNLSGGYNGDLYAYLSYGGVLVPLLNRVGVGTGGTRTDFGYSDAGMNITLSDSGANNVHFYQEVGGYSITGGTAWRPDGRAIDPLGAPSTFDAAGTVTFGSYTGMNPNGTWTLLLADLSGGEQSQLVSWTLDITAVPEPVNVALGILGGVFLVVILVRSRRVQTRVQRWRAAVVEWINAV